MQYFRLQMWIIHHFTHLRRSLAYRVNWIVFNEYHASYLWTAWYRFDPKFIPTIQYATASLFRTIRSVLMLIWFALNTACAICSMSVWSFPLMHLICAYNSYTICAQIIGLLIYWHEFATGIFHPAFGAPLHRASPKGMDTNQRWQI